jgi:hypothetical protein
MISCKEGLEYAEQRSFLSIRRKTYLYLRLLPEAIERKHDRLTSSNASLRAVSSNVLSSGSYFPPGRDVSPA